MQSNTISMLASALLTPIREKVCLKFLFFMGFCRRIPAPLAILTLAALATTTGMAAVAGAADEGVPLETAAAVYREAFPQMTQAAARAAPLSRTSVSRSTRCSTRTAESPSAAAG